MDNSTLSLALTGVVPAVCDAEAGEADEIVFDRADSHAAPPASGHHVRGPKQIELETSEPVDGSPN